MSKHPLQDKDWQHKVNFTRFHVDRTLRCIRNGAVDEEDLDKLYNLLQNMLALMETSGPKVWKAAKERALYLENQNHPTERDQ